MSLPTRLVLHVGLPKSGTSFLQTLLAENREALRGAGAVYPFVRPEAMFHAAVELRGQHAQWGLPPDLVDGSWRRLLARVRSVAAERPDRATTGIISHEILAGALAPTIERVAADTADLDLHVVVTARDLGRQVTAHWQEQVKNGRTWTFAELEDQLFGPAESAAQEEGFWRSQDLLAVLERWGAVVPAKNVHLVVVPAPGAAPGELWRRFAQAAGLDPGVLRVDLAGSRNTSLGAAQVALLRRVVEALDGRLGQPDYAHVVKRYFAQNLLGGHESRAAVVPEDLRARLDEVAGGWVEALGGRGWSVHGDPADLVAGDRLDPAGVRRHPDDVTAEEVLAPVPEVVAALLLEVARLRAEVGAGAGVDGPPGAPGPRPRASEEAPPGSGQGWSRRLHGLRRTPAAPHENS